MTRRSEDIAKSAARTAPTAAQVIDYLRRHHDFLLRHPEALDGQLPPGRDRGHQVVDIQRVMVTKLNRDMARMRSDQDDLVANSRDNLVTQNRVHQAVLSLLAGRSLEHLIEIVTTDLLVLLDVDVVTVCIEATDERLRGLGIEGVQAIPPGTVDAMLGVGRDSLLRDDIIGDPMLFGAGAGLVRSDALLRLTPSPSAPPGLLVFGTRHPGYFHPGQGTELLHFLVRVLEQLVRAWLDLPA